MAFNAWYGLDRKLRLTAEDIPENANIRRDTGNDLGQTDMTFNTARYVGSLLCTILLGHGLLCVGCASGDEASTPTDAPQVDSVENDTPADSDVVTPDTATTFDAGPPRNPYPEPGAWGPPTGPGAPAINFTEAELYQNCAFITGGVTDTEDHHNLVVMYDGLMLMPWAPEWGLEGGLSFFDISEPCEPKLFSEGLTEVMRETHSIGFSHIDGAWAVTNHIDWPAFSGGIMFWDISDITAPKVVSTLLMPGFGYPDSYARVTMSVFWQAPYVYVAGADNGIYVIDATDPTTPEVVHQHVFEPVMRTGQVQAIGNLLVVTAMEGPRTVLMDISDPAFPQPIPGGDYLARDAAGEPREAYFTNTYGQYIYYARKEQGGGLMIYDISNPEEPTFRSDYVSDGNGGYVFVKEDIAYVGESNFAALYDVSDLDNITEITRLTLEGDLDTITPIGNLAILSVDADGNAGEATTVTPALQAPDISPPQVLWTWPEDGAKNLPLTSRFGLSCNEMVEPKSAWTGSVRLYIKDTDPALTRVEGHISVQEHIVNFVPAQPLAPGTTYVLEVPAGGLTDYSMNALVDAVRIEVTTFGMP